MRAIRANATLQESEEKLQQFMIERNGMHSMPNHYCYCNL